jgi:ribosomal protein L7/L12
VKWHQEWQGQSAIIHTAEDAFRILNIIPKTGWEVEARRLWEGGDKIRAIKFVRAAANIGLKEAKDACEQMFS